MSDPIPGLTNVSFTCAYWDFLRGHRAEPLAKNHGLIEAQAVVLRALVRTEFDAVELEAKRTAVQLAVAS